MSVTKIFANFQAIIFLLLSFITLVESPGNGAAKESDVLSKLKAALSQGGINLPDWLIDNVGSLLIKWLVAYANKSGFFDNSKPA